LVANNQHRNSIICAVGEKIQNVEMLADYTKYSGYDGGNVLWKVAIIPKGTSQDGLVSIAKQLARAYPKKRIRIFDDKAKVKQFIQRDIWFNDQSGKAKEVPFPEQWVVKHHIANIIDRSDMAINHWQLVTRYGKHIAFLE
jgi:hypothetical protein